MVEVVERPPLPDAIEPETHKNPEDREMVDNADRMAEVEEYTPVERAARVARGLDIVRTRLAEYFGLVPEKEEQVAVEPLALLTAMKEVLPSTGKEVEDLVAIEGLLAAIRNRYAELSSEGEDVQSERVRFVAECGEFLAFVQVMEKSPEGVTSVKDTKRPPTMRECLETIKKFLSDRLVSLVESLEERDELDSTADTEDDDDYYDDGTDIESPVEPETLASTEASSEKEEESALEGREFVFTKDKEVIWEDPFTVVTEEPTQIKRWQKMLTQKLVRGRIVTSSGGAAILHIDFQPLPWFVTGRKEFVKKNRKYEALFPGSFERIHEPGTDGKYLPEDIFFEPTGKAMNMFLADRWDEYVASDQYRFYKKRQEEIV
jgi:hypothetical protein